MARLAREIDAYLDLCRRQLHPLLDRRPWTDVAVNPAPEFRAVFSRAERSPEFAAAARAFDEFVSEQEGDDHLVFEGPGRCRHFWHLVAFFWNAGIYDDLICGRPVDGSRIEAMVGREANRTGVTFTHAAFLEDFGCDSEVDVKGFTIRHLENDEARTVFVGRSRLDQRDTEGMIQEALRNEWFAVVRFPARPLKDYLFFKGAIGLHDLAGNPFRNINLGLNLFKATPGPAVIRQTFHWSSSLFHRQVEEYPRQSGDLFPSSWSGPEEPPPMRLYRIHSAERERLRQFWREFKDTYVQKARFLPLYVHRAVDRFLRACEADRTDWEFRLLLYMMSLEALFWGEKQDNVRPKKRDPRRRVEVECRATETVAKCCAHLVTPESSGIRAVREWVFDIYKQRSRIAHGSTFEQDEFLNGPLCPDEHEDSQDVCHLLGVDAAGVVEGPDVVFAVLHNLARASLLFFIGRAITSNQHGEAAKIVRKLSQDSAPNRARRAERQELETRLEKIHHQAKRTLIQELYDCQQDDAKRSALHSSSPLFVHWALKP